jgi:hypothetical protein
MMENYNVARPLVQLFKGTVSRDFSLLFFLRIILPQASENNTSVISIFSKIRGDIRKSRCTTAPAAVHLPLVPLMCVDTSGKFATGVIDTSTSGKFAAGVNETGSKLKIPT